MELLGLRRHPVFSALEPSHNQEIAVTDLWQRLQRVLDARFAGIEGGALRSGASPESIQAAEAELGLQLPDDLRDAYLHFDGVAIPSVGTGDEPHIPRLILPFYDWASLGSVVEAWRVHRQIERSNRANLDQAPEVWATDEVRDGAWMDRGWVPVGNARMSTFVACDLNPAPAGRHGQLIRVDLEDGSSKVIAPSFSAYMERLLDAIESGALIAKDNVWVSTQTGEKAYSLP